MPDYKLSDLAAAKLRAVLRDSLLNFGDYHTASYYAEFIKAFELLAKFPGIARRVDNIRPVYRRRQVIPYGRRTIKHTRFQHNY